MSLLYRGARPTASFCNGKVNHRQEPIYIQDLAYHYNFTYPSNPVTSANVNDCSSNSKNENGDDSDDSTVYSLQSILSTAKALFLKNADNEELFELGFHTTTDIYECITKQLLRLPNFMSESKFERLL